MYQRPFGCDETAAFVVKCRGLRAGSLVVVAEQIETSKSIVRIRFMPHLGGTHVLRPVPSRVRNCDATVKAPNQQGLQ